MAEQEILLELPEQPATTATIAEAVGECKLRSVNRAQLTMAQIDVRHLVDERHPGRGIWDITGKLKLSRGESAITTRKGEAGRAAWPLQLLIAVWLYGYSQGITSARELERQMEYEPGLMWLAGPAGHQIYKTRGATQIAPWLAAISCQFLLLKLLKPLIEIVRALPGAPPPALREFSKAARELLPFLLAPSPAGVPFVRDLLCLEIESLNCLRHDLQSMAKLEATEPSAVSVADVQGVLDSYQPMVGLLELANPRLESAGIRSLQAPPLGPGTDANSLAADQETLAGFVATLQVVVDSLGGCQ